MVAAKSTIQAPRKNQIKWCSIPFSEIVSNGKRLEASVFDVESKRSLEIIASGKYPLVDLFGDDGFVVKAHYGNRLKRNYVDGTHEKAIGFIGSSEMLDVYPQPVKFMVDSEKVGDLHVNKNTVLLSRSGTIGNMSFVNRSLSKLLISEHAIRLECRNAPGYVYAYLKTKIGQDIIRSKIYGAVVSQIEPEHLATIQIPKAPEPLINKINSLVVQSYGLRDESNDLVGLATKLLNSELKIPPIHELETYSYGKGTLVKTFSVRLSNLANRFDGSYHIPVVDMIIGYMQRNSEKVVSVGDEMISKEIILPGRFKRVYVDEEYGQVFIGGKQILELDPSNKKFLSKVHHKDRIAKQLELHEGMTLITCSGTVGKVTLVGKHWENWAANQHIIRIVPANGEIAGYLSVFLASDYGSQLITRFTYGSVVDEIDDSHVRQIPIPLLKNHAIQRQINDLALQANEKRYQAYCLEQKALQIMNDEVILAK